MHFRVIVANVPFRAAIGNRPEAERGGEVIWFLELKRQKKGTFLTIFQIEAVIWLGEPRKVDLILFYYRVENIIEKILYFTVFKHKYFLLMLKKQEVNLSKLPFLSALD